MDIRTETREIEGVPVIEVGGEVDVYTAPKLKSRILDVIDNNQYKMVIDLNAVDFMDSSGLGVLVGGLKRVGPHEGKINLACNRGNILKIFQITGLNKVFAIFNSADEAVSAIKE
ncbi:MAG: anti-sigma factor antagonist [Actinobacteria bacterium]|nr:MAG: anti-sigma factor antagonist [Actinomycetota bacterium]